MEEKKFDLVYCRAMDDYGVIQLLEAHGGDNSAERWVGGTDEGWYYIDTKGKIRYCNKNATQVYDFLKSFYKEIEPPTKKRWRAGLLERFWAVRLRSFAIIEPIQDLYCRYSNDYFERGNYFQTEKEAQEYADKINQLFKDRL